MLENTEGAIKNGQSRETGNIGQINVREYRRGNKKWTIKRNNTRRRKTNKNTTQYVLDTTIRKETQITNMRHEPSYKQLEVKMNRT
jgi:hypothetical protein